MRSEAGCVYIWLTPGAVVPMLIPNPPSRAVRKVLFQTIASSGPTVFVSHAAPSWMVPTVRVLDWSLPSRKKIFQTCHFVDPRIKGILDPRLVLTMGQMF